MKVTSVEYFNKTVCEFREQMGLKTFWKNENHVEAAKKALCHTFFNLEDTKENTDRAQITFEATMIEFTRRACLLGVLI